MREFKETPIGSIPSEWDVKTLDEIKCPEKKSIISGPFGSSISAKYFTNSGIPVIRGNNLSLDLGTRFKDDGFVFISEEKANELGTWAVEEDIIFTAVGTIGQIGIIERNTKYKKYIISNKQLRLRVDKSLIEPLFAYYWLASPQMVETIEQRNTGSSVPLINLSVLKSLLIPIPTKSEREHIVEVLSSLDDKIDLLHRQNKTLAQLAETLFRHWFVEGNENVKLLGDLAKISTGKGLKRDEFVEKGIYPVLGANGEIGRTDKFLTNERLIITGRVGTLGEVKITDDKVWISDNVLIINPSEDKFFYPIYFTLKKFDFENINAGSTQPLVTQTDLKNIDIYFGEIEKLKEFQVFCKDQFQKIKSNTQQIRTLTQLRDTLLPKLMSGEVRVAH
ncbi:MAG: restriction endonuclease subunit S [Chitinophagales bacterium]|nr:restriction endonuclease subunit S [Chitinophagales bacterium]